MTTGVLVFDGDCAFCTAFARLARSWVATGGRYAVSPWQQLDLTAYGLTRAECTAAAQFVDAQGTVYAGHLAVSAALRHGAPVWRPLGILLGAPGIRALSAHVYRWVATHRYALPGGTPACAMPGAQRETA